MTSLANSGQTIFGIPKSKSHFLLQPFLVDYFLQILTLPTLSEFTKINISVTCNTYS